MSLSPGHGLAQEAGLLLGLAGSTPLARASPSLNHAMRPVPSWPRADRVPWDAASVCSMHVPLPPSLPSLPLSCSFSTSFIF